MSIHRHLIPALAVFALLLGCVSGCRQARPQSAKSFDEIEHLVRGKDAAQILLLLGKPDTRQRLFDDDEKWVWWNYTFLDGQDQPPELRGSTVHLEIAFRNPSRPYEAAKPYSEWSIDTDYGVRYVLPQSR